MGEEDNTREDGQQPDEVPRGDGSAAVSVGETALRESQAKYQMVLRNSADAIMLYKLGAGPLPGRFVEMNDAACRMLEYSREELRGLTPWDVNDPAAAPVYQAVRQQLLREKQARFAFNLRTKSGRLIPVEITSHVISVGDTPLALAVVRDKSEHRRAQVALDYRLKVERAVAQVAGMLFAQGAVDFVQIVQTLGQAVDASRTYIFRYRNQGREADKICEWCAPGVTAQMAATQGVNQDEYPWFMRQIQSNHNVIVPDVTLMPPEARAEQALYTSLGARSLLCVPIFAAGELWGVLGFVDTQGVRHWLEEDMHLLRGVSGMIGIYLEREQTLRELLEAATNLQHTQNVLREREKLAIIGQMAAGVAHEVKNPLTAVRGFAQLLREQAASGVKPSDEFFDILISEVDRACGFINDFLQLAKPKVPELDRVDLNQLVRETVEIFSPQAFLQQCSVQVETAANLPACRLDQSQIMQVLLNLCQNAVEAMPGGGVVCLRTGLLPERGEVVVEVQDSGSGIEPERLASIGVPFFTTKAKGNGLGLSISYRIVHDHGGHVEVTSQVGVGTRFQVFLPAGESERGGAGERAARPVLSEPDEKICVRGSGLLGPASESG